jgi:transcriptional regulator with XRE-family HTH domain
LITGPQFRAARALLDLSIAEVAKLAGLAVNTVRRAERSDDVPPITPGNMKLLRSAFEQEGVDFIEPGEFGPGVRFRDARHSSHHPG